MKTRYVLVDYLAKEKFEKEWHLPYGFGQSNITFDIEQVNRWINCMDLCSSKGPSFPPGAKLAWLNYEIIKIDEYGNQETFYKN